MGKQNRKQAPAKKPISSHPLFPAIVAMWFGALFGLGSLAVRASLLESIVIAGHIDTLVPSAAPPLGITARIMLALAMAMIGGTIGALIARRIARPKPVARERRRGATPAAGSMEKHSKYGLNEPLPAAPYAEARDAQTATPVATGRRRALAIAEEVFPAYIHDAAPLPGGPPQILDVTEFDLADENLEETEIVRNAPAIAPHEVQPLDLSAFDSPGGSRFEQPQGALQPIAQAAESMAGQFSTPAPFALADAASPPFEVQTDTAAAPGLAEHSGDLPLQSATAPQQGLPRFAAPSALPGSFGILPALTPAGFKPEAKEFEERTPELLNGFAAPPAKAARFDPPAGTQDIARAVGSMPAGEGPGATVDQLANAELSAPAEMTLPEGRAAQRLVTAVLAELSPVELIERLALTLQNRKIVTTRSGQMAGAAPSALAAASEPAIAFPAAESAAAAEAAMPEPATQPAAEAPSPMHLTMPAALRPIDFREYEDADDSQARVPLRSISLPPAATGETPSPAIIPSGLEPDETPGTAQHDAPAGLGESIPETGEDVVEDAYSSLLDLSRPVASRQQFVRIEEQDADSGEIEPVVIFPGQAAPTGGRFSAPGLKPVAVEPVADLDAPAGDSPVRRFDAPGNAPAAVAARPAGAPLGQDAAETEQALRSALASLQRMSGAA